MTSSRPNAMTRAGRVYYARLAREHGYHDHGDTLSVRCPKCRESVSTRKPYGGAIVAALDAAMVDHLEHYCVALWGNTTIAGPSDQPD